MARNVRSLVRNVGPKIVVGMALVLAAGVVHAAPPGQGGSARRRGGIVSPTTFGRVFEANRSALVRVRARTADAASPWATGFFIGAAGEVVFGATKPPVPELAVELDDGAVLSAALLGWDRGLGLAVARITAADVPRDRHFAPLRVASADHLVVSQWVLVLKHDAHGRAEPFAGEVEAEPAENAKRRGTLVPRTAPVFAPGAPGSPVLSASGELVAVALVEGARKTEVVTIQSVVPFLKATVLGPVHVGP